MRFFSVSCCFELYPLDNIFFNKYYLCMYPLYPFNLKEA